MGWKWFTTSNRTTNKFTYQSAFSTSYRTTHEASLQSTNRSTYCPSHLPTKFASNPQTIRPTIFTTFFTTFKSTHLQSNKSYFSTIRNPIPTTNFASYHQTNFSAINKTQRPTDRKAIFSTYCATVQFPNSSTFRTAVRQSNNRSERSSNWST